MRSSAVIAALFLLVAATAMAQNVVAPSGSIGGVGSLKLGSVSVNQPINPITVNAAAPGTCPTSPQQFEIADTTAGPLCLQIPFSAISGTATDAQLASAYSGVGVCGAHSWASTLTRNAGPTCTQPSFSDLLGTLGAGQFTATTCTNQFVSALSNSGSATCTTDTLASAQHANQGTTTTVLHGNAAGNPSWASVADADLANAYSGTGACGANTFATTLSRNAVPTCTQPATTNLSDVVSIGTWTPTIFGQSTAGTVTYTIQDGHYAKIGRLIIASAFIRWSAISGMTGSVSISLPSSPTVLTSTNYFPEGAVGDIQGITFPAGTTYLTVEAQENTSRMDIFDNGSNVTSGNLQATALAGAGYLIASIQYLTN